MDDKRSTFDWDAHQPDADDPFERLVARGFALQDEPSEARGVNDGGSGRYERFELLGELARGGMGVVHTARDLRLERIVAVKLLRDEHLPGIVARARFHAEARIAARLEHPGIPPVYDAGVRADGRPFFAMRLVEGRSLASILADRPRGAAPSLYLLQVFEKILDAVAYAHSQGVVHRDLKPSNVMVGAFGEVQVMDWGLAKVVGAAPDVGVDGGDAGATHEAASGPPAAHTVAGAVLGTASYMAPEQARGEVGCIDARTDVFAIGGILCELLTGAPTFLDGPSSSARDRAAAGEVGQALARLATSGADSSLVDLAQRCLVPARDERPADAGAVREELAAYLAGLESQARSAEVGAAEARVRRDAAEARAAQERRARRTTTVLAAVAVAAVTLGFAVWTAGWARRVERAFDVRRAVSAAVAESSVARATGRASTEGTALGDASPDIGVPDVAQLGLAVAAAEKAVALAANRDAEPEVRRAAADALAAARSDEAEARDQVERRRKDTELVARLDDLRTGAGEFRGWEAIERGHGEVLAAYGIDVDALPEDEAIRRIHASRVGARILAALDEWRIAAREAGRPERAEVLFQFAQAAESDPWRRELREAFRARSLAGLQAVAASADPAAQPLEAIINLANTLGHAGDPAGALRLLRDAILQRPDDYWGQMLVGYWCVSLPEPRADEAVRAWTAAVALEPTMSDGWSNLGYGLTAAGDPEAGARALRRALELDPGKVEAHVNLGLALKQMGDFEGALASWIRASELRPDLHQPHAEMGVLLVDRCDLTGARDALREAARLAPRDVSVQANLGAVCAALDDSAGTLEAYRAAAELQPGVPRRLRALAAALVDVGRFDEAEVALASALEMTGGDPADQVLSHEALAACRRLRSLERRLEELLAVPVTVAVEEAADLGRVLLSRGRYVEAFLELRRAVVADPDGANVELLTIAARAAAGALAASDGSDGILAAAAARAGVDWVRALLVEPTAAARKEGPELRRVACRLLVDPRLAPLRERELLERTAPGVAQAADDLWAEVAGLLGR